MWKIIFNIMPVLIIDNFDSFTYNLEHYTKRFCNNVVVKRNNEILLQEVDSYDSIIISPGPGLPKDAGISVDIIKTYAATKKILGVCLGHQAIGEAFGAKLLNLYEPLHGVAVPTYHNDDDDFYKDIPNEFLTGRYHSWVIDAQSLVDLPFTITANDKYNQVQSIKHNNYNLRSVQFHPESVLTKYGLKMIENWIKYC